LNPRHREGSAEFNPRCLLVTGGAGFIGSHFVRWVLTHHPEIRVANLDALTYAANPESLADVLERYGPDGDGRYYFVRSDIREAPTITTLLQGEASETLPGGRAGRTVPPPDAVVHLAAESHVDRSIMGPAIFIDTNVRGTLTLLECIRGELLRAPRLLRFLHVSTDEVYGALGPTDPPFTEATPLAPRSPYSASKAGSDLLVQAYHETFELPVLITRCSNNYGPYQFPEKLIPLMITRALRNESLPLYADGLNVRDWLHVEDHARALWVILTQGQIGRVYNIGGESERTNLDVVKAILRFLEKPEALIRFVKDRPGHDRRYAMDASRMRTELDWKASRGFEEGLRETVEWYVTHEDWWTRVLTEAYRAATELYLGPSKPDVPVAHLR
jgi:dTDP-glucose 4,6-dehydratase